MRVYVLVNGHSENSLERADLLVRAANELSVEAQVINLGTANRLALPFLRKGDALYNATRGGLRIEDWLWKPGVITFWSDRTASRAIQDTTRWIPFHERAGIRQPRTVSHCTSDRGLLTSYVKELGGLPIVIKIADSTLGQGVIKIDSTASLFSLIDHLEHQGQEYVLREFVNSETTARIMVVGSRAVAALRYLTPKNDFRTNVSGSSPGQLHVYPPSVCLFAVKATQAIGSELGGVDLAFAPDGSPILLEINVPCGFSSFEHLGIPVARTMIKHLVDKGSSANNGDEIQEVS